MSDLLLYLLKANIVLTLFCLGYYLWLRKLTFYGLNRYYLLFSLLFSALSPFFQINKWLLPQRENAGGLLLNLADLQQLQLPQEAAGTTSIFPGLYWLSVGLFAFFFLVKLGGIGRIYWKSVPAHWGIFHFRSTAEDIPPFSFWPHIYFNPRLHAEAEYEKILRHEQRHIRDLHTLDILLAELAVIFFWYNPFCWMIRKAVQDNNEFITDRKVLASGVDKKSYQYSLVQISTLSPSLLGNHFNFKNLKKRILMMNRKQSSKMQLGKYVFILPAIILGSLIFGVSKAYENENIKINFNIRESATLVEEKDGIINQSSQSDAHKAVIIAKDTLPSETQPIIVLDGNLLSDGVFSKLDSEEIQSIDVIVDAAAISIYGTVAENGIIKITTKQGDAEAVRSLGYQDTVKTNDPLYVVDGVKQTPGNMQTNYHADEIAAVNVLKGNSAIDAHGEEGKHGVIEITTKQATESTENYNEDKEPAAVNIKKDKATTLKSINDNVLIFVDGKKMASDALDQVNPNDIESITVLKGENAIERHGAEAKDGVIEIITKSKN